MNKIFYKFSKYKKPNQEWVRKNKDFYKRRNTLTLYNLGMYATIFGLCYGMVPIYRVFCEHVGLEGDTKQKDYSMEGKILNTQRKYKLIFKSETDPDMDWDFEPVNEEMIVNAGETALTFYKALNHNTEPIIGFATYQIFPEDALLYFSKVQCFCFHQQMLIPKEEIFLPIYFYLEPEINDNKYLKETKEIKIIYKFYKAKQQDLAKMAQEEIERVENNQRILAEMRAEKKRLQNQNEIAAQ